MTIAHFITRAGATTLLATGLIAAGAVQAQENQSQNNRGSEQRSAQAAPQSKEMMQLQQRMRELQKQIQELQQQALKNNPELKKQRDELQSLVNQKMREEGVEVEAHQQRLEEIRKKMQGGDVSRKEQKSLAKEFRNKRSNMMKARRSAMQDKEVQASQKKLRSDLEKAMKQEDPKAGELIKEYRGLISELRKQRQQSRSQGGAGGSDGPDGG